MDNFAKLKELISLLESSGLKKLQYKEKDFEVTLESKDGLNIVQEIVEPVRSEVKSVEEKIEKGTYISSPMVGTFYSSPSPDKPPFVKKGDRVNLDTIVCIIEAMKVMNEVRARCEGVVVEVLVENNRPVEFGTKLFRVV